MAQRWLHRIRDQSKMQQIRWRDMEVLAHCGLVFMSVAHLTSTTLFVPKLDVMYLGLAVVIWLAVRTDTSKSHRKTCLLANIVIRRSRLFLVQSSFCAPV